MERESIRAVVHNLVEYAPDLLRLERDLKVLNAREADAEHYGKRRPAWRPFEKRLAALIGTEDADPRILLNMISAIAMSMGIKVNKSPLSPPRGYEVVSSGRFRSKPNRRRRELQEADS